MQVKLDIQGELAEYIKEKAKKEFRSGKQQVLYMLNDYYNREMELKNNPTPVYVQNQGTVPVMMYVPHEGAVTQEQMQSQPQVKYNYVNEHQSNSNQVIEHQTNISNKSSESYESDDDDDYDYDNDESILY